MSGKERPPVVAVASGKGGTGKTTVATNLARTAAAAGLEVSLLDTDVEEPNCGLFLSPVITRREEVTVEVPAVHESACTGCGACAEICEFSAIAMAGAVPMVFPELCHACGGCRLVCPVEAIIPRPRPVGVVEAGYVPGPRDAGRRGDAGSPDAGP
ncbi:MAG: 4Fe-4S binding protein, partial [Spirochaetaceae bacterium]